MIIPENGAGGYTFSADFIRINIDDNKATKNLILPRGSRDMTNGETPRFDGLIFERAGLRPQIL